MPDDIPSRLRRLYQPVAGLLLHDWGESAAVVFVPGTGATHLIDGEVAALLANWSYQLRGADGDSSEADVASAPETSALETALDTPLGSQLQALLQAGILQQRLPG